MTAEELEDEKVAERRAALKVALLGGAAAIALAPKPADAQFFGGGIGEAALAAALYKAIVNGITDTIREPIDVTREITEAAFSLFRQLGIPSAVIALLNDLLGLLGTAGDDSMSRTGTIPGAMERSWPLEIPRDTPARNLLTEQSTLATRARVEEACMVCATAAERQDQMAISAAELVAEANAAAAAGNVTTIMLAQLNMTALVSQQLSQLITMTDARTTLDADGVIREQAQRWSGLRLTEQHYENMPNDLAPRPVNPLGG